MKSLINLLICFLISLTVVAQQNNIWSIPSNYINFGVGQVTPLLTPIGGYNGLPAQGIHNAMQDVNGNLLFFIVDGSVYDNTGGYIDPLTFNASAEILIVPDPDNCQRFYIIGDYTTVLPDQVPTPTIFAHYSDVHLNVVDFTTGVPIVNSGQGLINIPGVVLKNGLNHYSASKLRPDNSRFVYVHINGALGLLKIDGSGISILPTQYPAAVPIAAVGEKSVRAEMELVEYTTLLGQQRYKIAFPYFDGSLNGQGIYYAEIAYATGTIVPGTERNYIYPAGVEIKGLEFSPNTNYLYITHTNANSPVIGPFIEYFDVTAGPFTPQLPANIPPLNAMDFQYSQIELGTDGKLYFAGETMTIQPRLATIGSPNTPLNPNWNQNALPLNQYPKSISTISPFYDNYILPDQIDGMDYSASFTADESCCAEWLDFKVYSGNNTHEYNVSGTWSPAGLNPWTSASGIIEVRDRLVIKSGTNITANNMTFKFAPQALLIIENGATLTLDNCTLTVDNRCNPNAMWHGVEVWGQGTGTFQPTTAGKFITKNNTLIEHAIEAVCNYLHNVNIGSGGPKVNQSLGNEGGIIQLTDTKLRNNMFDVYMRPFKSMLGVSVINDLSRFINCEFVTDAALNNPANLPVAHARLNGVNGIQFKGCDFENTTSGTFAYIARGTGIQATETKFSVTPACTATTIPCPLANIDKCHFNNLTRGITANSNNNLNSVQILNSEFYNNWRSVFLRGLNLANVSDNMFDIGMNSGPAMNSTVSAGLLLRDCDGYKVENNNFSTSFNGHVGCGVINSGINPNEIYRNTFNDLVIGTQSAQISGSGTAAIANDGLEFRCNTYYNTSEFDILVSSGRVKSRQGSCTNNLSPANNRFSYTAQFGDYWLENFPIVSIDSWYYYSQGGTNLLPLTYNPSNTSLPIQCTNVIDFDTTVSCPLRGTLTATQLKSAILAYQAIIDNLNTQIDGGDTQFLLTEIATTSGGGLKNTMLDASPYLSDDVLLAYALSNPSNGNLKQVLLANSPLSTEVMDILSTLHIPNGIMNQINNAQNGISPRQELEAEVSYYESEITKTNNDIIRILLFEEDDITPRENFKNIADFLREDEINNNNDENQLLVNALMANQDFTGAQQKLAQIHSNPSNADFCKLKSTVIACQQYPEKEMVLLTDMNLQQKVNEVSTAITNKQEVASAQILKEEVGLALPYIELIEMVYPSGSGLRINPNVVDNEGVAEPSEIKLYPNPADEQLYLTHNLFPDRGTITLKIYDLMGRNLLTKDVSQNKTLINISSLNAGVYFYTITKKDIIIESNKLMIK